MHPKLIRSLTAALIAGLPAVPALAQEDGAQEDGGAPPERKKTALERAAELEATEISAAELLTSAIQRLQREKEFVVRANVKHKQPEIDPAKPGAPGRAVQVIMRTNIGNPEQDPFEGKVEAWRDANGATTLVSQKELPGFGLFMLPDRTIRRTTFDDKAPGLKRLQAELASLLDGRRLAPHLSAAKLTHRRDEATGDHIFSGEVSRDVVRPIRADSNEPVAAALMASSMMPRVLRAEVELRLSKAGDLKQTRFTIVRNDPGREMLQRGLAGRVIIRGGAGGQQIQIPQPDKDGDADKDKHDIEGVSTVYTLDLTASEPSERARAFKREIQRLIAR